MYKEFELISKLLVLRTSKNRKKQTQLLLKQFHYKNHIL